MIMSKRTQTNVTNPRTAADLGRVAAGAALAAVLAGCSSLGGHADGLGPTTLRVHPPATAAADGPALPRDRSGSASLVARASAEYRSGKAQAALATLADARRQDPLNANAYDLEAQIALDLGDRARHVAVLQAAIAAMPNQAALQHAAGNRLVRAGEWAGGVAALKSAVRLAPQSPAYAMDLAAAYFQQGATSAADQVLAEAAQRMPGDTSLPIAMARLHESAESWAAAASHYEQALRRDPHNQYWRRQYARCLYLSGNYQAACSAYSDYMGRAGAEISLAELIQYGDSALRIGDYARAQAVLDDVARRSSEPTKEVELLRGVCALRRGDEDSARKTIAAAMTQWPGESAFVELAGHCAPAEHDGVRAVSSVGQ